MLRARGKTPVTINIKFRRRRRLRHCLQNFGDDDTRSYQCRRHAERRAWNRKYPAGGSRRERKSWRASEITMGVGGERTKTAECLRDWSTRTLRDDLSTMTVIRNAIRNVCVSSSTSV